MSEPLSPVKVIMFCQLTPLHNKRKSLKSLILVGISPRVKFNPAQGVPGARKAGGLFNLCSRSFVNEAISVVRYHI